jgi:aryl-alcohol dehydrogenase-like predicted oxidoreductase
VVDRREFFKIAAGAGAAMALTPELLRAVNALEQQGATLIRRAIPSTGEKLPVIGLSFSNHPACADRAGLRDVLRALVDNGGTVFDAMHGNATAEQFHAAVASELGVQNTVFWSTRGTAPGGGGPPQPGAGAVKAHIDTWLAWTKASRMDLVMLPVAGDPSHLAALKEEKKAGRVRYIGVQTISANFQSAQLAALMRSEPLDFIGVDYDVSNRRVENTILPLALERKIAVMAFFPFGNNGGVSCGSGSNLFGRIGNRPVPAWAAEFDAKTWSHFFTKYVIGHPAVTVARVGTTRATHMIDNIGGGVGRLPNEATRKRMAAFIDALPPVTLASGPPRQVLQGPAGAIVLSAAVLDRYVGEYKTATGTLLTFRRYGTMMTAKPGDSPETVIYAHSETRFSLDQRFIEFQLDSAGRVTGLVLEQGTQTIGASRIR